MTETEPTVTVCIASYNTRYATELTIRSARRRAGRPFQLVVGDGASTDGTLAMLERLQLRGLLTLDRADGRRTHAEWLDHWYSTTTCRFLVFSDSDVFYLRNDWLTDMVEVAEHTGAAIVAGRIQPDWSQRPSYAGGTFLRSMPGERPEPCLMLLDLEQLRGLVDASFAFYEDPMLDNQGHNTGYDIAGWHMRSAKRAGLSCIQMPEVFQKKYRHWGGLTWKRSGSKGLHLKLRARQLAKMALLRVFLVFERGRDRVFVSPNGHSLPCE